MRFRDKYKRVFNIIVDEKKLDHLRLVYVVTMLCYSFNRRLLNFMDSVGSEHFSVN